MTLSLPLANPNNTATDKIITIVSIYGVTSNDTDYADGTRRNFKLDLHSPQYVLP